MQATHVFRVSFDRSSPLLCRLIGLFAQRDEPIAGLRLRDAGEDGQLLVVTTRTLAAAAAAIVAEKMRVMVGVRSVELS